MLANINASQKCTLCTIKSRVERFYCGLRERYILKQRGLPGGALAMFCGIRDQRAPFTTEPAANTTARRARHGSAAGIGCLLAGLVLFTGSTAHAACSTAPLVAPTLPTSKFFFWGPSAVCAAASAGISVTSAITTLDIAFLTQSSAFVGVPGSPFANQLGGGVWIRVLAVRIPSVRPGPPLPTGGATGGASIATSSQVRTDFSGFQAGADLGRFNLGASGINVIFGVTGGLLDASATELAGPGN